MGALKPATNAPIGSDGAKPIIGPGEVEDSDSGSFSGPVSQCEPFRQIIEDKLDEELTRRRIYQDLVAEYGFTGSYYSVRRFVKRLGKSRSLPYRRMETAPGDEAQVDFGKADWYDPEVHPKIQSFCKHYGTAILPAKPYMPRHKGKIERGIGYVKSNALKGRTFSSLAEQNEFLLHWEINVADMRIHGTTRRQVARHLER